MDDIIGSLVDRQIKEYDLRLSRIDHLLTQAAARAVRSAKAEEYTAQLEQLKHDRDELAAWLNDRKAKPLENWKVDEIRKAGPMGVWDAVAQQVEKLVEHIDHHH